MKPEEIQLSDWVRILLGETPPSFFMEVGLRTLFLFLLLIISMRLLGRRMAGQLSRIEMVALFSLAAAIGVPLQAPDRGLLPSFVIAIVVIVVGRLVALLVFRSQKFEARVTDRLTILMNDGVVDLKKLKGTRLTIERVFSQLRLEGIRHLGEVKRLYIEANGSFSLVKEPSPKPGLSILPDSDTAFLEEQQQTENKVCKTCGRYLSQNNTKKMCSECGNEKWVNAIM